MFLTIFNAQKIHEKVKFYSYTTNQKTVYCNSIQRNLSTRNHGKTYILRLMQ